MDDHQGSAIQAAEKPTNHAFVLFGTNAIYLAHSAMFLMEEHAYQAILAASLDDAGKQIVAGVRQQTPKDLILALATQPMLLNQLLRGQFQVDLYRNAIGDANKLGTATVSPTRLLYYRPLNQYAPDYMQALTYLVFGHDGEAFMSHIITKRPNFHHEVTLMAPPGDIEPQDLERGVLRTVLQDPSSSFAQVPDGFYTTNPLPDPLMLVNGEGLAVGAAVSRQDRLTYQVLNGDD